MLAERACAIQIVLIEQYERRLTRDTPTSLLMADAADIMAASASNVYWFNSKAAIAIMKGGPPVSILKSALALEGY